MGLDFFYNVSYATFASMMAERQATLAVPNATVFLNTSNFFTDKMDGGIDIDGNHLSHPCLTPETALEFFNAIDSAIQQSKADYMMILEPDVFVSKEPSNYPKDAGGITRNQLGNQERLDIEKYLGHVITPYYSMAGGSVISTKVWKQNRKNIEINKVLEFFDVWSDSRSGDAFISMVLWYFKMHIEDWEELYESHMGDRKWTASVFHGIKNWYNYE